MKSPLRSGGSDLRCQRHTVVLDIFPPRSATRVRLYIFSRRRAGRARCGVLHTSRPSRPTGCGPGARTWCSGVTCPGARSAPCCGRPRHWRWTAICASRRGASGGGGGARRASRVGGHPCSGGATTLRRFRGGGRRRRGGEVVLSGAVGRGGCLRRPSGCPATAPAPCLARGVPPHARLSSSPSFGRSAASLGLRCSLAFPPLCLPFSRSDPT